MQGLCILLFALLLVASQGACDRSSSAASQQQEQDSVQLFFENGDGTRSPTVNAEIANSESERRLGLMYRKELSDVGGMVFVFPTEEERAFWMRNTFVELDIIFLSKDLQVVSIVHRARPLSDARLPSGAPAKYVVEVKGGLAKQWGVTEKSSLRVLGELPAAQY